jgi:hypothetical protein
MLHIFRKDVRHLWPQILVILALFVTFDILEILSFPLQLPETQRIDSLSGIAMLLLTLAIWYVVALAIYQEALPGNRQFWLTKPYSRSKLLGAKVLFIVIFINVPLLLSDCIILGAQGFPALSSIPRLVLRQIVVSGLFILPSFAIATVTRGVAQFVFAWFLIVLSFVTQTMVLSALSGAQGAISVSFGAFEMSLVVVIVTGSIIIWQYAKRQSIAGSVVLIVLAFAGLPAIPAVSMLARHIPGLSPNQEVRSPGPANIRIAYELGRARRHYGSPQGGYIQLSLPIRVDGLPADTLLEGNGPVTIDVGGKEWPKPHWRPATSIERSSGEYWQNLNLEASALDKLKDRAANIETSLHLTLVSDKIQTSIPVVERSFWVPHLGHCYSHQALNMTELACRAGVSFLAMAVRIDQGSYERLNAPSFANPALPSGFSPTSDFQSGSVADVSSNATFDFIPRRELVSFDRALTLRDINLSAYAISP